MSRTWEWGESGQNVGLVAQNLKALLDFQTMGMCSFVKYIN